MRRILLALISTLGFCILHEASALPPRLDGTPFVATTIGELYKLRAPVDVAWVPDGRVFVAEKAGRVRVYNPCSGCSGGGGGLVLQEEPLIDIRDRVDSTGDRGLNAIAIDRRTFLSDPWIFVFYSQLNGVQGARSTVNKVMKVPIINNIAMLNRSVIILGTANNMTCTQASEIDCLPLDTNTHAVCQMTVLKDGSLLLSVGDGADYRFVDRLALGAQRLDNFRGKFMRIDQNGNGLPDNPFFNGNASSVRSKIWALGFRNPFRGSFKPDSNESVFYMGQIGWVTIEALYAVTRGINVGWPCYEGSVRTSGYQNFAECRALYNTTPNPITFPIYEYNHNGSQACIIGGCFTEGKAYGKQYNGTFWFGEYVFNQIKTTLPSPHNTIPNDPVTIGYFANPVGFRTDPEDRVWVITIWEGTIYRIDLNTTTEPPAPPSPTPLPPDGIRVNITLPLFGSRYAVNDRVLFAGRALDGMGIEIDPSLLTWTVILHHCYPTPDQCHLHFGLSVTSTESGFFEFPDHDDNSWVEIQLAVVDPTSADVLAQASTFIYAREVKFTVDSCMKGVPISYSAFGGPAPFVANTAQIGGLRTLSVPDTYFEPITNKTYNFVAWSDCDPSDIRDIEIPTGESSISAIYRPTS